MEKLKGILGAILASLLGLIGIIIVFGGLYLALGSFLSGLKDFF